MADVKKLLPLDTSLEDITMSSLFVNIRMELWIVCIMSPHFFPPVVSI